MGTKEIDMHGQNRFNFGEDSSSSQYNGDNRISFYMLNVVNYWEIYLLPPVSASFNPFAEYSTSVHNVILTLSS